MTGERWGFAVFAGLVLVLLVSGCTETNPSQQTIGRDAFVQLSFMEPPILGKDVNLVMHVKVFTDYNDGEFGINLSSNFITVDCNPVWKADLLDDEERNFTCIVRAIKKGYSEISGYAASDILPESECPSKTYRCARKIGGTEVYVYVDEDSAIVSDNPESYGCQNAQTTEEVKNCMRISSVSQ